MSAAAVRLLGAGDVDALREMLALYAREFDDAPSYLGAQPDAAYLADLLARDSFVAIAAFDGASSSSRAPSATCTTSRWMQPFVDAALPRR